LREELLPFGGFFVQFELAGLNLRPGVGIPWQNIQYIPTVRCVERQLILFRRAVASAEIELGSIEEFRRTRVANLGDFFH
jgi:hypothetical protein